MFPIRLQMGCTSSKIEPEKIKKENKQHPKITIIKSDKSLFVKKKKEVIKVNGKKNNNEVDPSSLSFSEDEEIRMKKEFGVHLEDKKK